MAAYFGVFLVLPSSRLPHDLMSIARDWEIVAGTGVELAFRTLNHEGRYLAYLTATKEHRPRILKAFSPRAQSASIAREIEAIDALSGSLPLPLRTPRVLDSGDAFVVYEAIAGRFWPPAWRLPIPVARAMGEFAAQGNKPFQAHGDFAPWNVIEDRGRSFYLLDWENYRQSAPPYFDVAHWFVQSHTLLGRPTLNQLLRGVRTGEGEVGKCLQAYSVGAQLNEQEFTTAFLTYLDETTEALRYASRREINARKRRIHLREQLNAGT
jgi:hypothetical protein